MGGLIVVIAGATATGKTDLAEAVAARLGAEVVCADSRQVFRELVIGTGKPDAEAFAARPHHLFDARTLADPAGEGRASAGWYARAARAVCAEVHARGRPVVLVGGSGLYLAAARRGLASEPPHDPEVRARIRREMEAEGPEALHARLGRGDPESAARLGPRDRQRIARALEVLESSGRTLGWWRRQPPGPGVAGAWRTVVLDGPPAALDPRIETRTRWMFDHGLVEETRGLVAAGLGGPLAALRAVGYDEALDLAAGRLARADAEARVNLRTRQLAKRQRTWFRHQFEGARLDATRDPDALLAACLDAIGGFPDPGSSG